MKTFTGNLYIAALALLMISGLNACASKEKTATGPGANPAVEAKQSPETAQHGSANVQAEADLKRRQDEDAARLKQAEMDNLKEEEAAKIAAANSLHPEQLTKVFFDFDRYEIKKSFHAPLEHDAKLIKDHAGTNVVVTGHCDERGSEEYNLALGERRAMKVKAYLVSLGVNEGQLHTMSYGEERPADNGHDEKAWSQNRRVQFSQE